MLRADSMAPIERLPAELVQNIFLLADMDPNLPKASHILSRSLSDYYILSKFCERAFIRRASPNQAVNYRERQERLQRQKVAFDMRWMTWSFFSWYLTHWATNTTLSNSCPSHLFQLRALSTTSKSQLFGDGNNISQWLLHIICPLPNKLLRAPHTDEKLAFLRCLLAVSSASVDWASKEAVRLSTLAKRDAILGHNLEAVHLLSRTRRLSKAPNLELVKFAVIEGGCDRSIVFELMTAAREWGHRRWADVELDAWVAQEGAKGNPKARWLKLKLEELRYGKYPNPRTGDYIGDCLVVKDSGCAGALTKYQQKHSTWNGV